jgi:hypothetical protein
VRPRQPGRQRIACEAVPRIQLERIKDLRHLPEPVSRQVPAPRAWSSILKASGSPGDSTMGIWFPRSSRRGHQRSVVVQTLPALDRCGVGGRGERAPESTGRPPQKPLEEAPKREWLGRSQCQWRGVGSTWLEPPGAFRIEALVEPLHSERRQGRVDETSASRVIGERRSSTHVASAIEHRAGVG